MAQNKHPCSQREELKYRKEKEEKVDLGLQFQRESHQWLMAGGYSSRQLEQEPTESALEMKPDYKLSSKAPSSKGSTVSPPAEEQGFKYLSLWNISHKHFSFKCRNKLSKADIKSFSS